jgi:hypothetical protein
MFVLSEYIYIYIYIYYFIFFYIRRAILTQTNGLKKKNTHHIDTLNNGTNLETIQAINVDTLHLILSLITVQPALGLV